MLILNYPHLNQVIRLPMQLRGSNILLVHFCVGIGDMLTTQSEMMDYFSFVCDELFGSTKYATYLEQS